MVALLLPRLSIKGLPSLINPNVTRGWGCTPLLTVILTGAQLTFTSHSGWSSGTAWCWVSTSPSGYVIAFGEPVFRPLACVRIPVSRPGIMWTCIVRVTGIMSMVSEGEGIQYACGQFEHAIDSVHLARVKRKEKKRKEKGESRFPFNFVWQ